MNELLFCETQTISRGVLCLLYTDEFYNKLNETGFLYKNRGCDFILFVARMYSEATSGNVVKLLLKV